jgi:GNAT superfamily N-acetyltransferase
MSDDTIRILDYDPRWRDDFRAPQHRLARTLLRRRTDRPRGLSDPERHILADGGRVLFAIDTDDRAVGTVALKHEGEGVYELTKMAVDPAQQGRGIGRRLLQRAIDAYRQCEGANCSGVEQQARHGRCGSTKAPASGIVPRRVPDRTTRVPTSTWCSRTSARACAE